MSKFFEGAYFDKPFYSVNQFFHEAYFVTNPFFTGIGGGTPPTGNPVVPKVLSSVIQSTNDKRILVTFDQEMRAKGDIKTKMWIVIDGASPVLPSVVTFSHDYMTLSFPSEFKAGTVISWKYDDSDPTIVLESTSGVKADNQTYAVTNNLVTKATSPKPATKPTTRRAKAN